MAESIQTIIAIRAIDRVLNYFSLTLIDMPDGGKAYTMNVTERDILVVMAELFPFEMNNLWFQLELPLILDKLHEDKYIRKEIRESIRGFKEHIYTITFNGRLFNINGGYRGQLDAKNAENIRLETLENRQKEYNGNMVALTSILAVGVSAPFLWNVRELLKSDGSIPPDLRGCLILFSFGLIIGALMLWTIQTMLHKLPG